MSGNTILITGGGSGIGEALAHRLHDAGNTIIIAGRRQSALAQAASGRPNIATVELDVENPNGIASFAARIAAEHPKLDVLINNAGIMQPEDWAAETVDLSTAEATIAINLLGPLRLTAALLPLLRRQPRATIINVTSGLAFVPRADTPTYSATKAALHSFTQSLRHQLRNTGIQVAELAPPLVGTDLTPGQRRNPRALPLDDFIAEVMQIMQAQPDAPEILVERVLRQRRAEATGTFDEVFSMINPA